MTRIMERNDTIMTSRRIVGFDIRDRIESNNITSIDCNIWPESQIKTEIDSQNNGFNLFDSLDESIVDASVRENASIVAFDIPRDLATALSPTFGLEPLPIEYLFKRGEWLFLGYDIVDVRTQCSAIYSFDIKRERLEELLSDAAIELNQYGLIENQAQSFDLSAIFDKLFPEHSPFTPCGIHVAKSIG